MNTHSNQLISDVALWPALRACLKNGKQARTHRRAVAHPTSAISLFGLAAPFLAGLMSLFLPSPAAAGAAATPNQPSSQLTLDAFKIITQRNIFDQNRRPGSGPRTARVERRAPKIEAFSLFGVLLDNEGTNAFFNGTGSDYQKVCKPGDRIAGYTLSEVTVDSCKLVATNGTLVELPLLVMQMRRQDEGNWQLVVGTAAASGSGSDSSSPSRGRGPELGSRGPELGGRDRGPSNSFGNGRDRSSPGGRRDRNSFSFSSRRERGSGSTEGSAADSEPASDLTVETTPDSKPAGEPVSDAGADEVLKRLMQKREQELNK